MENTCSSSFRYGQQLIVYSITRRKRTTLAISVMPDLHVEVVAPLDCTDDEILGKIKKRARWILSKRKWFSQFLPGECTRHYVGGETHLYLGKKYRLKFLQGEVREVKLKGGFFEISNPFPLESIETMKRLDVWYRIQAVRILSDMVITISHKLEFKETPKISIRRMNTRWGSLALSGRVSFNLRLIQAPVECIEYVVLHELCHLVHFNHTHAFYELLEKHLPDWEQRKIRLEGMWG